MLPGACANKRHPNLSEAEPTDAGFRPGPPPLERRHPVGIVNAGLFDVGDPVPPGRRAK